MSEALVSKTLLPRILHFPSLTLLLLTAAGVRWTIVLLSYNFIEGRCGEICYFLKAYTV